MNPSEIAILQAQRGQATKIPGRQVQVLRGLGAATGPVAPVPPPPPPSGNAGAQSTSIFNIVPWWAWPLIVAGAYELYRRRNR